MQFPNALQEWASMLPISGEEAKGSLKLTLTQLQRNLDLLVFQPGCYRGHFLHCGAPLNISPQEQNNFISTKSQFLP